MDTDRIIEEYRQNGYVAALRKYVGHAPIMGTAGGLILENDKGEILLQRRRDNGRWGIIGGAMEIGESIEETVLRETYEEAGIRPVGMTLFGIYTGKDRFITYPNGDICYVTSIVFKASDYEGRIKSQESEVLEHRFFSRSALPLEINLFDEVYIRDWAENKAEIVVR